jgi:hypothetical protein
VDRLSHAEIGGPYANREDADRAIRGGGFQQSPAELVAMEGEPDGDADDSKTAAKTAGFPSAGAPQTPADPGPADPGVPELGQPVPEQQFADAEGPMTTKPAQKPEGASSLPEVAPFDTEEPGGGDSVSEAIDKVSHLVRMQNPGMDIPTVRRIARQVVGKLVEADFDPYSMVPHVRDPLAHRSPADLLKKMKPEKKPGSPESPSGTEDFSEDQENNDQDGDGDQGDQGGRSGDTLNPFRIFGPGESPASGAGSAAGESAAGGEAAAGLARIMPMLLV